MAVPDHAVFPGPLKVGEDADVSNWVDALSSRGCTPDEFFAEILRRERADPEVGWEALALLDQKFRQQRISREIHTSLKNRLQQHFVSAQEGPRSPPRAAAPSPPAIAPVASAPAPAPALALAPAPALTPAPAPMVATREVALGELPIITTAMEAVPAGPVEVPFHVELRVGDKLRDRYRVVEILRRHPACTLVEAIDEQKIDMPGMRKRVAILVVDEALSRDREYLLRIGKLQSLSHPAIARLFDVEEHDGVLLLVMELLNGPSLYDLLGRTGSSKPHVSVAQSALRAAASALTYAHSQGIAHGDVSSRNLFVTQAGEFRLLGFESQATEFASTAADRRAFARLAYQVLAGTQAVDPEMDKLPVFTPPGLTRRQWRALRRTLNRRSGDHDVFAAFAGDAPARSARGWRKVALVAVVVALGTGGYLYSKSRFLYPTVAPVTAAAKPAATRATPAPPARVTSATTSARVPAAAPVLPPPARALIDLPVRFASVDTLAPVARIWVRRRDNLASPVTFTWSTESGSAEVDRDYRRIEPRTETIPAGEAGLEVLVPLIPDPDRAESRTFWVKIEAVSRGARLGESALMQVAIVPAGT